MSHNQFALELDQSLKKADSAQFAEALIGNIDIDGNIIQTLTGALQLQTVDGSDIKLSSNINVGTSKTVQGNFVNRSGAVSISSDLGLSSSSDNVSYLEPTGADRSVIAEASPTGSRLYWIANTAALGGFNLIFKDNGGTQVGQSIAPQTVSRFGYDPSSGTWKEFRNTDQSLNEGDDVTFNSLDLTNRLTQKSIYVDAYNDVAQTITDSTDTVLTFNSETVNENFGTRTDNTKFQPNVAGKYTFNLSVKFNGNSSGNREVILIKNGDRTDNGASSLKIAASNGGNRNLPTSAVFEMNGTTDYVQASVRQNRGGDLTVGETAPSEDVVRCIVRAVS